jgi:hypothetical protein
VGALISRALGPPGLWPIARVRRPSGIVTTLRDSRYVVLSIKTSCHCKARMRGCRGVVLLVASESAVVGGSHR